MAVTFDNSADQVLAQGAPNTQTGKVEYDNLYLSPYLKPLWDDVVHMTAPQYSMSYILGKLSQSDVTKNDTINWTELGDIQIKQTIGSATISGRTAEITLDETERYFVIGDVIQLVGVQAQITDVDDSSGQVITVQSAGTANLTSDNVAEGAKIWRLAAHVAPCAAAPLGTTFFPKQRSAGIVRLSRSHEFCVDTMSQPLWYKGKNGKNYQYFLDQQVFQAERVQELERSIVFFDGFAGTMASGVTGTPGMIPLIQTYGVTGTIAGAWTEDDFKDVISELKKAGSHVGTSTNEYIVFAGLQARKEISSFMEDNRRVEITGAFAEAQKKGKSFYGLQIDQYMFNGVIVNIFDYPLFNNIPSDDINWESACLFLNVGTLNGERKAQVLYKEHYNGVKDKMFLSVKYGHLSNTTNGGAVAQTERCWTETYSTSYILKLVALGNHGFFHVEGS
jgi:hypothetical protein